jgi:hypothetical protein
MRLRILGMLLFAAASGFSTSFPFGESIDGIDQKQLVELITENGEYCTDKMVGGRIYLKSGQIYPSREGVFLRINQFDLVRLSCVCSDDEGCYILP